jgi:hypothetical protein
LSTGKRLIKVLNHCWADVGAKFGAFPGKRTFSGAPISVAMSLGKPICSGRIMAESYNPAAQGT